MFVFCTHKFFSRVGPVTETHNVTTFLSERTSGPSIYNFAVVLRPTPQSSLSYANEGENDKEGKVIGILGSSAGFPTIGYLFNPNYGKQGYATEALNAFVPKFFEQLPSSTNCSSEDGSVQSIDYIQAYVDTENINSMKLLERCGWTRCEVTKDDYTSAQLGLRDAVTYRKARPGMNLEDVVNAMKVVEDEEPPVPDLK